MESPRQMNVLLQGDVGSGKTIVAAYSLLKAIENDKQAILMAPTEVLAEQHLSSLRELLRGIELRTALLSGSRSMPEKEHALKLLASGEPSLIVGTHALIQKKVSIPNAGLVIIDEQHRFGVSQRAALREKGVNPDLIVMTATPIPRTLALALYGNFETIVIDECPPGRHPVETRHVSESDRRQVCQFVREEISGGRQAFVVCPEIGEQRDPAGTPRGDAGRTAVTASRTYAEYKKIFPGFCDSAGMRFRF
jgi:ATP-dependent DNA helicase RecG